MDLDDPAYAELCGMLEQEAQEQVERMGVLLLELEHGVDDARRETILEEVFRQAHNLKGAATSLGFTLTSSLAHGIEGALSRLRTSAESDVPALLAILHDGLTVVPYAIAADPQASADATVTPVLERLVGAEEHSQSGQAPRSPAVATRKRKAVEPERRNAAAGPSMDMTVAGRTQREARAASSPTPRTTGSGGSPDETLRVSMHKLNALMAQVGELLAARMRTDQRLAELRQVLTTEEDVLDRGASFRSWLRDRPLESPPSWKRVVEEVAGQHERQKQLVRQLRELVRTFETDATKSTILSGALQEDIRRIQTFPLSSVLDPLPRAVRNMAHGAGKDARLEVEGAELELDKRVLDALRDPIQHLLNNAVDHGIEAPDVRRANRKQAHGTIRIRAEHRGEAVVITIADDGPGVDLPAVQKRAVARGLLSVEQAQQLPAARLCELLFEPSFTTRTEATRLSGRGVGLDVVRTNVEHLRGTVTLDSEVDVGTTVTIVLPLTVYVIHSLILRVGPSRFAIPISSIERIARLSPSEVMTVEKSEAMIANGKPIALLRLADILGIEGDADSPRGRISVVVVRAGDLVCALAVDEIVGDATLLVRNLEPPLVRVKNIGGASILGDGSVLLVLTPLDLLRSAMGRQTADRSLWARPATLSAPRLLLADDSFTTRALERSVLELAGFDVVAVSDGVEAFHQLETNGTFDVVVSDVDMPRLSGLELCRRIRAEHRWRALPIVLVTSLGSEDDRRRGLEVGADAYVVKSEFDHEQLARLVNRLVGRE